MTSVPLDASAHYGTEFEAGLDLVLDALERAAARP
jgi:hypothetical protein